MIKNFGEIHNRQENLKKCNFEPQSPPLYSITVSYDEIKQKVITQANDYHRVKAYTP